MAAKFDNIGILSILNGTKTLCAEDLVLSKGGVAAILEQKSILNNFGSNLKELMLLNSKQKQKKQNEMQSLSTELKSMKVKDFIMLKKLGAGQFGNVYMVMLPRSSVLYSLKCISKAQVVDQGLEIFI